MSDASPQSVSALRVAFDILATRALTKVATELRRWKIPCVPVKGIVLARTLYAHVEHRPFVDVDLLVSRSRFDDVIALVKQSGWRATYLSREMGELLVSVDGLAVEFHAEIGRPDLTKLNVDDFIARSRHDSELFGYEVLLLDDVDHFLLLVGNVVKDGFAYANPHQHVDLDLMLARLDPRTGEVIDRAREAAFLNALRATASWMATTHGSIPFLEFKARLGEGGRPLLEFLIARNTRAAATTTARLSSFNGLVGLLLASCLTDDARLKARAIERVVRRGLLRKLGRNPDHPRLPVSRIE